MLSPPPTRGFPGRPKMLRSAFALPSVAFALSMLAATDAMATAQRTFVASNGNDANPCSLTAPCRGFAAALVQTTPGGEIVVLDSAGYGPVTISQSVSIIAPAGVYAGVSVLSGTGIFVNPGSGTVVLSGLTINGLGGTVGINFQSGTLRIERTTISGFSTAALGESLSAAATLVIHDSAFIGNGIGIFVATSTGIVTVEIDGSRFDQNSTGAAFVDNVAGTVSGSSFSKNSFVGAFTQPGTGTNNMTFRNCVFSANVTAGLVPGGGSGTVVTQVTDSEISDNPGVGVQPQTGATATFSSTTITRNGAGVNNNGGTSQSFKDNRLYGNTADGAFSTTIANQ